MRGIGVPSVRRENAESLEGFSGAVEQFGSVPVVRCRHEYVASVGSEGGSGQSRRAGFSSTTVSLENDRRLRFPKGLTGENGITLVGGETGIVDGNREGRVVGNRYRIIGNSG